jgi:aquaporin Z
MSAQRYAAEFVGTFILVAVGSLTIVAATAADAPILIAVPFGFGLGLLAAIVAVGHISGGHYNPAVTLGALLDRRISVLDAIGYVVAQVVGAVVASLFVLVVAGHDAVLGTRNLPGGVGELSAFVVEVVLTAVFLLVILSVTKRSPNQAPLAISLALAAIHFAGIPLSGASVNPARALGPALVGTDLASIWIYLTAPFVGAIIGWAVFRALGAGEDVPLAADDEPALPVGERAGA